LPLRSKRPKKEIRGFSWWFEYENNTRKIREGYEKDTDYGVFTAY
jgi:hypothetical protein